MIAQATAEPVQTTVERPWRRGIGTGAGIFLGLVLLVAAWAKALDPTGFAEQIHAQRIDGIVPGVPASALALVALGLEVGLGAALLLGIRRLWVLVPASLLIAFFLFLTGRAYWLSLHGVLPQEAGCGCFGNLVERSPAEAFWQDVALLVPALALSFLGRGRGPAGGQQGLPRLRLALVLLLTAAAIGFAWKAPALPLDDFATRLRPGVSLSSLCASGAGEGKDRVCLDTVAPFLVEGDHVVILADLDDPAFQAAVPRINSYVAASGGADLVVLATADAEHQRAFFWRFAPAFDTHEAPAPLLRPLYRRLPRSFEVHAGRVTRTWSGLPPLQKPAAATTSSTRSPAAGDSAPEV
jgi:uncharacterized membrane protein YphA (DoxX/SURF4 family)